MMRLLLFLLVSASLLAGSSGGALALDATSAATTEGRCQGEVNVLGNR